ISSIGFSGIAARVAKVHGEAFAGDVLPVGGFYRARSSGETHADHAEAIHLLQSAVQKNSYPLFRKYSQAIDDRPPVTLRHLLDFRSGREPVPLDEVEPVESILTRLVAPGMSL